jgi:prepilin-type N-terminal cleavage/methylation domain-containing protein
MNRKSSTAFTLIELLIVIAILGVLMALLFPAALGAIESARRAKAKNDLVQICVAVKAYQTEYGRNPVNSYGGDEANEGWFQGPATGGQYNSQIIKVLQGDNSSGLNPRQIVFFEGRTAKSDDSPKDGIGKDGIFYDPWGTPYAIKIDTEYDNLVEYYGQGSQENLRTTVIAISFGKNKIQQDPNKSSDKGQRVDDLVSYQ